MRRLPVVLLPVVLLLGGCSLFGPDASTPLLRTDADVYEARVTDSGLQLDPIAFAFLNTRVEAVYLPGCGGPAPMLQKLIDGEWVAAWSPIVTLCLSPSVRVGVGQTYHDTLHVLAGLPSDNRFPKFEQWPVAGTYRLTLTVDRTEDPEHIEPLPLDESVSNPFELRAVLE